MRKNKDGQGVLDGVPTDEEIQRKNIQEEAKILSAKLVDTHSEIGDKLGQILNLNTYEGLNLLNSVLQFIEGLNTLKEKNGGRGSISYKKPNFKKLQIDCKFQQWLESEKATITKKIDICTNPITPEIIMEYDELINS